MQQGTSAMGTNYYVSKRNDEGNEMERLHLGKSSAGWVFSLRVYSERSINNLYDWLPIIVDYRNAIFDEYGIQVGVAEMLHTIVCRGREAPPDLTQINLDLNQAEISPNNLLRSWDHQRHGEGTWQYCNYDFF